MSNEQPSLAAAIRSHLMRHAVVCGLYVAAAFGALAAYLAAIAVLAIAALDTWGWGAAFATIGACFGVTSLVALLAAMILQRRSLGLRQMLEGPEGATPSSSGSSDVEATGANEGRCDPGAQPHARPPSPGRMVAKFLAEYVPIDAWVAALSVVVAALAIMGPIRVIRLGVRLCLRAATLYAAAQQAGTARRGSTI